MVFYNIVVPVKERIRWQSIMLLNEVVKSASKNNISLRICKIENDWP